MTTGTDTLARHWIDGAWQEGSGSIAVVNPATGETLAEVPAGGAAEIDAAVLAARHAFPAWAARPLADRVAAVTAIREGIKARSAEIAAVDHRGDGLAHEVRQLGAGRHADGDVQGRRRAGRVVPVDRGDRQLAGRARADRRRRGRDALELPAAPGGRQGRAGAGRGLHDRAQAQRGRAADREHPRRDHRRGRPARRRLQRRARHRARGRRGPGEAPGRRHGVVHRLGARRAPGAGGRGGHGQARGPGARRQVRQHRPRRRRPHPGRQARPGQLLHQRRPDLHGVDPAARARVAARPGRRDGRGAVGEVHRRRPDRGVHPHRADVLGAPARARRRLHHHRGRRGRRRSPPAARVAPTGSSAAPTSGRRSSPACART